MLFVKISIYSLHNKTKNRALSINFIKHSVLNVKSTVSATLNFKNIKKSRNKTKVESYWFRVKNETEFSILLMSILFI